MEWYAETAHEPAFVPDSLPISGQLPIAFGLRFPTSVYPGYSDSRVTACVNVIRDAHRKAVRVALTALGIANVLIQVTNGRLNFVFGQDKLPLVKEVFYVVVIGGHIWSPVG
jgi:hypothetical protein